MSEKLPEFGRFDKNWAKNPKFLQIKGISKSDLEQKKGEIVQGDPIKSFKNSLDFSKKKDDNIFTFGKYRGKTFDYVRENDYSYYAWAKDNIKNLNLK